jgi:hypothetical protein
MHAFGHSEVDESSACLYQAGWPIDAINVRVLPKRSDRAIAEYCDESRTVAEANMAVEEALFSIPTDSPTLGR